MITGGGAVVYKLCRCLFVLKRCTYQFSEAEKEMRKSWVVEVDASPGNRHPPPPVWLLMKEMYLSIQWSWKRDAKIMGCRSGRVAREPSPPTPGMASNDISIVVNVKFILWTHVESHFLLWLNDLRHWMRVAMTRQWLENFEIPKLVSYVNTLKIIQYALLYFIWFKDN